MTGPAVVVVGGGLAGIAAALECADSGARVTLVERRNQLGGLTRSFRHGDMWVDNGQHVFLRCCTAYLTFLERIGARGDVVLQDRMDIPVLAPATAPGGQPVVGRLRRSGLPAPLHLAGSLLRYPHLGLADKARLGRAVLALRRLTLGVPSLDLHTFESWLQAHGQSDRAIAVLWDLITVPTVNLPAAEASLAMAAKVFKTGLLEERDAADIGWSRVPLGRLLGERSESALATAGVEVRTGERVRSVKAAQGAARAFEVAGEGWRAEADGVIVALPHEEAASVLPPASITGQNRWGELGSSSVMDVHLVLETRVTDRQLTAAVDSSVQWVFDRTGSSGLPAGTGQYLAVSLSASDSYLRRRPEEIVSEVCDEMARLFPSFAPSLVVDSFVTKERNATFRAVPGTASLRPGPSTRLAGLTIAGAWTDTGWPATMEGAVRSGVAAAQACLISAWRQHEAGSLGGASPRGSLISAGDRNQEEVA